MSGRRHTGTVAVWAWWVSICFHILLLIVFAVVKFSEIRGERASLTVPNASLSEIRKAADSSPLVSKPKVRKPVGEGFADISKTSLGDFSVGSRIGKPVGEVEVDGKGPDLGGGLLVGGGVLDSEAEFFGQKTRVRKICYVVDCSGSMYGRLGMVQGQLKESIGRLGADQYFSVIFFGGDRVFDFGQGRLVRASGQNKRKAYNFIDEVKPGGISNAIEALESAMKIADFGGGKAELIYFFSDGFDFADNNSIDFVKTVENMRKELSPKVIINTIGFWTEPGDRSTLSEVARKSGGEFVNIE